MQTVMNEGVNELFSVLFCDECGMWVSECLGLIIWEFQLFD